MRVFVNKMPRRWISSGVSVKSEQIEMSNFSFIEEYFTSKSNKFNINIIGKSLIGNGAFYVTIYKNNFIVWKEEFSFQGVSFSKKQISIEESAGEEFKIVISRGKSSKGKILINDVSISEEKLFIPNITVEDEPIHYEEDIPTFFIEKEIEKKPEIKTKTKKKPPTRTRTKKTKAVEDAPIKLEEPSLSEIPNITPIEPEQNDYSEVPEIKVEEVVDMPIIENQSIIEPPKKNDYWITVIDLDTKGDERAIFNILNQISFGKEKQIFFAKEYSSLDRDLSKYKNLRLFSSEEDIIQEIKKDLPYKLTFINENIQGALLEEVQRLKEEISKC